MRVVFIVPRRKDNGLRDDLWTWCERRWQAQMPDVPIYEGHHEDGPFNRAAAINAAARLADADGRWDVAVIIDSDVFLPIPHVRAAIERAGEGSVTWAHRRWRNIAERHLKRLLADPDRFGPVPSEAQDMDLLVDVTTPISWSCCVAVPRATFDAMGGFDERFVGWGFEDGAWAALVRAVYPWDRIDGDMYHLNHPRTPERIILGESRSTASNDYVRNALLGRRYMIAAIRDHAVGDQPGEEHLSAEMVGVHVRNLTTDDARFLAMAEARGMPETSWQNWWPTLDELAQGAREHLAGPPPTVAVIVRTGGAPESWPERSDYLRRSLASLEERVSGPIVMRRLYSDWGPDHRDELDAIAAAHSYKVVGPTAHVGYVRAVQELWGYIERNVAAPFVFLTEDDFLYDRDVDLAAMAAPLERDHSLAQVALLRGPAYPREFEGGILGWPLDDFTVREDPARLEHRLFWTMNPSLVRRGIVRQAWPSADSSERVFGDRLFRDKDTRVAFWGDGSAWTTHIGETRAVPAGAGY